jgi:alpha-galactosidase
MKKIIFFLLFPIFLFAQNPDFSKGWKIKLGDDIAWSKNDFNDADWKPIDPTTFYENQGYDGYNGYSWYRIKFNLPSSLRQNSVLKDSIRIIVGRVDDIDATYLNGVKIGSIGLFPDEKGGPVGFYDAIRRYALSVNHPSIRWDAENVIAVRVFDGGGGGGLWGITPSIDMVDLIDFTTVNIDAGGFDFSEKGKIKKLVKVENAFKNSIEGTLSLQISSENGFSATQAVAVNVAANGSFSRTFTFQNIENAKVTYVFTEKNTQKTVKASQMTPYILTPLESPKPKITNPEIFGARPSSPFLWASRATGTQPMIFSAKNLPASLNIDSKTGVISGVTPSKSGEYEITLIAKNALGKYKKKVKIVVGEQLALTPPMGWNSWNCWAMSVSNDKVKNSAEAILKSGLANHGFTYMVIDDGWQGKIGRNGATSANEKFPDMKGLSSFLHQNGLKFGIYSSPGALSCGGLLTSLGHEKEDAEQWANWGVDYVKYDWCSYNNQLLPKTQKEWSISEQILPFKKINDELLATKRDMILSVCNWGMNDVWKWADQSGGQLWRTSGDIEDSWASLSTIGFAQPDLAQYVKKGGWNDPDMLIVGWVGWGDKLHQTHLTPSEQYTHISLWAMLNAPMMIGCDVSRIDPFTYNLLGNDEIIAIDQDILGKPAKVVLKNTDLQVWVKNLADGSKAIGIFNLKNEKQTLNLNWSDFNEKKPTSIRDVWRQKKSDENTVLKSTLEAHGCMIFKVK